MNKVILSLILLLVFFGLAYGAIPQTERQALIALYNSTNGDNWTNNTNWKGNNNEPDGFSQIGSENTWFGVVCDAGNTTVTILNESVNNAVGTIPSELGNLSNLEKLYLNYNQLSGNIPPELGNLSNLQLLYLDSNKLTGSIPPELGNLTKLQWLFLYSNKLTGSIPPELGNLSNLLDLVLYGNQLTGSIPPELGNLSNLEELRLYDNQLAGSIPSELGNLSKLTYIALKSNQLTGNIPPELGNLKNLIHLGLRINKLTGSIPPELGNLSNLQELLLYSNQLTGSIPTNLSSLTSLTDGELRIRWNALYTNDDSLRTFLNSKQSGGDWESTQTIAPENVAAGSPTYTSIRVSWTTIVYTGDTGGYRVFYSTTSGDPNPTYFGITADKTVSQMDVTGLSAGTTYYFVVQTRTDPHGNQKNTVDSEISAEVTAATLIPPPSVTTNKASGVGTNAATLNGTVNANNSSTTVTFEYGTDTNYGTTVTADQSPVSGISDTAVSKSISGLIPNTTYHYRVVGQNAGGTANGADMTFNASTSGPTVTTNKASGVGTTSATLNGTVNAQNSSTTVTFQYGTDTNYGITVTAHQSPVTGVIDTGVSKSISGLIPNTMYHYRVVGQNDVGTTYGADMTFTTSTSGPTVTTNKASGVGTTSATLNGTVNANNSSTTVTFQYGTDTNYGITVTAHQSPVTGVIDTGVSKSISGLIPNTMYHYRVVGQNAGGTANGADQSFTSIANPMISGTITDGTAGIPGVTLVFSNGGGSTTTESDGTYEHTVEYGWSGTVTPSKIGYEFTPDINSYPKLQTDITNQNYKGNPVSLVISGRVTSSTTSGISGIPGVKMTFAFDSGETETGTTDADGYYNHTVDNGWSGTVIPSKTGYTFSPASQPYENVTFDYIDQDYTAFKSIIPTYSISGRVAKEDGTKISGVVLVFSDHGGYALTNAAGDYGHPVEEGWAGAVTPVKSGYNFDPSIQTYGNVTSDQSNQDYTAIAIPVAISGRVKDSQGIGISGVTFTFLNSDSGESMTSTTDFNGNYRQEVPHGWNGEVVPEKEGYAFDPSRRSYNSIDSYQHGQHYTAVVLNNFPVISGIIAAKEGIGVPAVTLTFSGSGGASTAKTDADGNYSQAVENGWSGTVMPEKEGYTFDESNQSYKNVTSNKPGEDYTAEAFYPVISGRVNGPIGAGIPGVKLEFSNSDGSPYTYTDTFGNYSQAVENGWSGTITPSKSGHRFEPNHYSHQNVISSISGQDYEAFVDFLFITGRVITPTGKGVADVYLTFSNGGGSTITDENGGYIQQVMYGWSGEVVPTKARHTFSPSRHEYHDEVVFNTYDQDYTATEIPPRISGQVTIEEGTGIRGFPNVRVIFSDEDGTKEEVETDAEGNYGKDVPIGWTGTVRSESPGYIFTPYSQSYQNVNFDRPGQDFRARDGSVRMTLHASREVEGTLVIKKYYGKIDLDLNERNGNIEVSRYIIYRRESTESIRDMIEVGRTGGDLSVGGTYTFGDRYIEKYVSYIYIARAFDSDDNFIAESNEAIIDARINRR